MTPKERVRLAVAHKEPDRVPLHLTANKLQQEKIIRHFDFKDWEEALVNFGIDIRYTMGGWTDMWVTEMQDNGTYIDIWGVRRGKHMIAVEHPLSGIRKAEEIDRYSWPRPEGIDYEYYLDEVKKISDYAIFPYLWGSIFGVSQGLVGMSELLIKMVEMPDVMKHLFKKITDYYLACQKNIYKKTGDLLEICCFGEDFATQEGLMISKDMWDYFFRPQLARIFKQAKDHGYSVFFHSCGAVSQIIPDLIEIGMDILDPVQPLAKGMDIFKLKKQYGDMITFHGNVDIQEVMPHGSVEDVKKEVLKLLEKVAPGGGLILAPSHEMQEDTPPENAEALFRTALEYGNYGSLGKRHTQ